MTPFSGFVANSKPETCGGISDTELKALRKALDDSMKCVVEEYSDLRDDGDFQTCVLSLYGASGGEKGNWWAKRPFAGFNNQPRIFWQGAK